uniref:Uncharacterized protein n=1 Tax=Leptobrachium leishanense TaxID=445787 RepID=A0A8C5LRH5_9ANUR
MMSKLSRFCYMLFFFIVPLYSADAVQETTTLAITTVVNETSLTETTDTRSTEYMPTNTNVTNVESSTVAPLLNLSSTTNTSDSHQSTSTPTTPVTLLATTSVPNTEGHTSDNGSLGFSNFTTRKPLTSQSSDRVTTVGTTTNVDERSTSSTATPDFSHNTTIAISPNDTSTTNPSTTNTSTTNTSTTNLSVDTASSTLKRSEAILTSIFSTILVIVILAIFLFVFKKYRRRRSQYSHHPLREHVYESDDRYSTPEDTLVISGGLYDAPRVYNPNMTVLEDEDPQHDYVSFSSRPGQFRLEFLPAGNDPRVH